MSIPYRLADARSLLADAKLERSTWNPRFLAYADAHGRPPAEQLAYDRDRFPGGCMVGFMLWIQGLWRQFEKAHGSWINSRSDHEGFDRYVAAVLGGHEVPTTIRFKDGKWEWVM